MQWIKTMQLKRASRAAHLFLLHLATKDILVEDNRFIELPNYLGAHSPTGDARFVAYYNRARGIYFKDEAMEDDFLTFLGVLHPEKTNPQQSVPDSVAKFLHRRREVDYMLMLFSEMLQIGWSDERRKVRHALDLVFKEHVAEWRNKPFFNAIVLYSESIAPPNSMQGEPYDRTAIVTFLSWAVDSTIAHAGNTVALVAEHLGVVAPQLHSETNAVIPITVPFLNFKDRIETVRALTCESPEHNLGMATEDIANLSAGLSRRALMGLAREKIHLGIPLDTDEIFQKKKEHLEDQAPGLLEITRSSWGLEAIGALEEKKEFIKDVVAAMKSGNKLAVPQGCLLLGGFGTGKTVFVQALAHMIGLPIIKLGNIRDKFVGESERRLSYLCELLKSYAPVIIFIDELDQWFQKRGTVYHGDSGVSARLTAKFMDIMSDTDLRGQLFWIGASNRPGDIDQAFLREGRMGDDILPFLPPDRNERSRILPAILHKLSVQASLARMPFRHEIDPDFVDTFGFLTHGHFSSEEGWGPCEPDLHPLGSERGKNEEGYTGAEIEHIVRKAHTRAQKEGSPLTEDHLRREINNFMPKRDIGIFRAATDDALLSCNSEDVIPASWREYTRQLRAQRHRRSSFPSAF